MTATLRILLSYNAQMFKVSQPSWDMVIANGATVYFEPCDEILAYLGDLLIKGYNIDTVPLASSTKLPLDTSVMLLTLREPMIAIMGDCRLVTFTKIFNRTT